MSRTQIFIKAVFLFICYLLSNTLIGSIFKIFKIDNDILINSVADIIFLFTICFLYKKDIINSIKNFNNKYTLVKRILNVLKYVSLIVFIMMIYSKIIDIFFKNIIVTDSNTASLYTIAKVSFPYALFKVLIFAPIAEELLLKKTIRDIIKNNIIYIFSSSFIYAFMNVIYYNFNKLTFLSMIPYLIFSIILNIIYIQEDDNIFIVMLVKFFYNLIPLLLLLFGV